ncbi:hypothetical protein WA158_007830 [Blastocystis sp. Blastoise]
MEDQPRDETKLTTVMSCKMCRALLFTENDCTGHEKFQQEIPKEKSYKDKHIVRECTSYFLKDPPKWCPVSDEVEFKIYCPNCKARLGDVKWQGTQCSCGTWVTPSIQINKSRVDYIRMDLSHLKH